LGKVNAAGGHSTYSPETIKVRQVLNTVKEFFRNGSIFSLNYLMRKAF
jgi:hypothetical protein